MSEHITHLAVAEDSARVVCQHPDFNSDMQDCILRYPHILRLGSVTRSGDTFILPSLTKWRKNWQMNEISGRKMAYILGWAGHLAGDRTFKPVFRITDLAYYVRGFPGPSHASIYHDAVTFDEVYAGGKDQPFHPAILRPDMSGHPAADFIPVNRMETALSSSFAAQLGSKKAFLPQTADNWEGDWKKMEDERQRFYVGIDRYTEARHQAHPNRMRQYIIDPKFYNPEDPIIKIARAVQRKEKPPVSLEEALIGTDQQSLYAQSLKLGYDFMKTCSDYFEKKISLDQAKVNFRIGQPHKQKLDYYVKMAEEGKQ